MVHFNGRANVHCSIHTHCVVEHHLRSPLYLYVGHGFVHRVARSPVLVSNDPCYDSLVGARIFLGHNRHLRRSVPEPKTKKLMKMEVHPNGLGIQRIRSYHVKREWLFQRYNGRYWVVARLRSLPRESG